MKNETIFLVFLKVSGKRKCKLKKNISGTMLLPLLTCPISDPTVQKWFLQPRPFGTTLTVVSAKICRFQKPDSGQIQARLQKTQKWRWARHQKQKFAMFRGLWFWGFAWPFQDRKPENPIFPAILGMCALYWQLRTSDLSEARVRGHRWNTEIAVGRCLIVSMLPQDNAAYFPQLLR